MDELKYDIKKEPKCVLGLDIEIPWSKTDRKLEEIYTEIKKHASIPGFRKGKIPMEMIKSKYGKQAEGELLNTLPSEVLREIMLKEKIRPVTTPKIEDYKLVPGEPFKLNIKVEVPPEVNLKKYKKLKLTRNVYQVTEEDVLKTINNLREKNASLKPKEGSFEQGDFAIIENKIFIDDEKADVDIPEQRMVEYGKKDIFPGFAEKLKGMKKGEQKEFEYRFPEDFPEEKLKDKLTKIEVNMKEIKKKEVPSNREIAESLGFKSVEEMKEKIKENLEEEVKRNAENEMDNQIIEQLLEKHEFKLPEGLIEERLKKNMERTASYVKNQGGDPSKIDAGKVRERTEREIRAGIILSLIAKEEDIKVTDEDIEQEKKKLKDMFGLKEEKEAEKYVDENAILSRKVFDFLKDNAKIKEVKVKDKK